jgi:hypothetical protein
MARDILKAAQSASNVFALSQVSAKRRQIVNGNKTGAKLITQ